ncbi:MAG TPA: CARDB domain-containing protein [Candidatus Paceibacterota bacterium]|nr:CARDB domain-containing protein [Candidatus Paceibacterota bacterium]
MIRITNALVFSLVLLGAVSYAPQAEAKSVSHSYVYEAYMMLTQATPFWAEMSNPNVTVTYEATITNADTGAVINDGAQVPKGTRIKIAPKPHTSDDIYWFGTGSSNDSPYGSWGTSAPGVTCDAKDFLNPVYYVGDVYVSVIVPPPTKTITQSSNMTCGAVAADGSKICTVTGVGAATATVKFAATSGTWHSSYKPSGDPTTCRRGFSPVYNTYRNPDGWSYSSEVARVDVPEKSITFSFNAVDVQAPPAAPTITCPASGKVGQELSFTFTAADPNSDQLRYGINWAGGTTVTQWAPASGYVNSGTAQTVKRTWTSAGTYTVRALAQDSKGASSAWASCQVTISASPDLIPTSLTPQRAVEDRSVTFVANISNAGGAAAGTFSSTVYICAQADTACRNSVVANANNSWFKRLVAFFIPSVARAATAVQVRLSGSGIAAASSGQQTGSYTFPNQGTYVMRVCADRPANAVVESNETNNCQDWTTIVVDPAVPPSVSCAVSPTRISSGQSVTYTTTSNGGATGPYTWTPSDGANVGTGASVTRTITTPGPHSMTVKGSNTAVANCPLVDVTATWCTSSTPDLTITAEPSRVNIGQSVELEWSARGVNGQNATCTVTGPGVSWSGPVSLAPSCSVSGSANPVINTQSTYTLTCGATSESVIVNVVPDVVEF